MTVKTLQMKPFQVFAPITRLDEALREVETYAFVNEVVEGEGGIRLLRSAMVDATEPYMEYANVREMHQPSAVGTVKSCVWDDLGCKVVIRVVDNEAWQKCVEGVYKGASVGVLPRIARGLDVTACNWFETSLVDRPKDPAAKFICLRAEGVDGVDDNSVIEVTVVSDTSSIQDFASAMAVEQMWDKGWEALDALWDVLYQIAGSGAANKEELIGTSVDQFKVHITNHITCGNMIATKQRMVIALPSTTTAEQLIDLRRALLSPVAPVASASGEAAVVQAAPALLDIEQISRIEGFMSDGITRAFAAINPVIEGLPSVIERLEKSASDKIAEVRSGLEQVNSSLTGVIERVQKVESSPVELVAPVRNTEAFRRLMTGNERHFASNEVQGAVPATEFRTRSAAMEEINRLSDRSYVQTLTATEQQVAIARVQELKRQADVLPD